MMHLSAKTRLMVTNIMIDSFDRGDFRRIGGNDCGMLGYDREAAEALYLELGEYTALCDLGSGQVEVYHHDEAGDVDAWTFDPNTGEIKLIE